MSTLTYKPGDVIVLSSGQLLPAAQRPWWSGLPDASRTLTVTESGPNVITGRVTGAWPIPGQADNTVLESVVLELAMVPREDAETSFSLKRIEGFIKAGSRQFPVKGAPDQAGYIRLEGKDDQVGLALLPDPAHSRPSIDALRFLLGNASLHYGYQATASRPPEGTQYWTADLPDLAVDGLQPKVRGVKMKCTEFVLSDPLNTHFALVLEGIIDLERPYAVMVRIAGLNSAQMEISAPDGKGFAGPADLLSAIGLKEPGVKLQEAINAVPVINSVKLNVVRIDFDLKKKRMTQLSLFGSLMVDEYRAQLSFSYPQMQLSAWLDAATPIPVGRLLHNLLPQPTGLPADMTVAALEMDLNVKPFRFGMGLRVDHVWSFKLGETPIDVASIRLGVEVDASRNVSGLLYGEVNIGEVDFSVLACRTATDKSTKWVLESQAANNAAIRIDTLIKTLARYVNIEVPVHLPEMTLYDLRFRFDTETHALHFSGTAELKEPLGPFNTGKVSISVDITKDNADKREVKISLDGEFEIQKSTLKFEAELGHPKWFLDAHWTRKNGEGLSLLDFVKLFDPNADFKDIPEGVRQELGLREVSLSYHHEHRACTIAATNSTGRASVLFQAAKTDKGWGAIFGLRYEDPRTMPEFGQLIKDHGQGLALEDAWVLFSWMPEGATNLPAPPSQKKFPLTPKELGKGLALGATLNLATSNPDKVGNLKKTVPQTQFLIKGILQKQNNVPELTLSVLWKGELSFDNGTPNPLILRNCGVSLKLSPKSFEIAAYGDLQFPVDAYMVLAHVELDLSLDGLHIRGFAQVPGGGLPLFGLNNVRLHSAGVMLGIGFKPPSVDLGFMAELTFRENQQQRDALGAVLAFHGPVPNPQYIAIDISRISLAEFIRSFNDANWSKRRYVSDDLVRVDGLSFHWAEKRIKLPDSSYAEQGFGFHGLFTIFGWKSWFSFEASEKNGFRADGQLEYVKRDGFEISGAAKDLYLLYVEEKGKWELVSNAKRLPENARTASMKAMSGGGPFIHFNSVYSPYLNADFTIKLLDAIQLHVGVLVADDGIDCSLIVHIEGLYSLNQMVKIKPPQVIRSQGSFTAGPRVHIGFPINEDIGLFISGHQDIQTGTEAAFHFIFQYNYRVLGADIPGPRVTIPHAPRNFGDVVEMCIKNFLDNSIGNLCRIIFGSDALICKLTAAQLEAYQADDVEAIGQTEPLQWIDRMEEFLEKNFDALNDHPDAALQEQWHTLLNAAESETDEEVSRMSEFINVLGELHPERVARGLASMEADVRGWEREWKELEDVNHLLRNRLQRVWDRHERDLRAAWIYDFEIFAPAEASGQLTEHAQRYRDVLEERKDAWRADCLEHAVRRQTGEPYLDSFSEPRFSDIAVAYYTQLIEIEGMNRIECDYIIEKSAELAQYEPSAIVRYIEVPLKTQRP